MRLVQYAVALVFLLIPTTLVMVWANAAEDRLTEVEQVQSQSDVEVARAAAADEDYCTPQLKQILRRVLNSCGLLGRNSERGCQPAEARNVATMSGNDFNALFIPMNQRGGIVQFDRDSAVLDQADRGLVSLQHLGFAVLHAMKIP